MGEFQEFLLGELGADSPAAFATGPFGSAVSAKNFVPEGIPMIRGSNLSDDVGVRLDDDEVVYVPEELALKYRRSIVERGDLIFTCWGTVGQLGIIDEGSKYSRYLVSNKQMKMTVDQARVLPMYLYYFLSQKSMIALIQGQSIGSSVPGFNLGQLRSLPVRIPPIETQGAIVDVLCSLDAKIAVNKRLISHADGLSRELWLQATSAAEPVPLTEVAEFVNGQAFTKDASGSGRVVVRIAELNSGIGPSTVYNDIHVPEKHLARPGDLLFAWSGSLTVARWYRAEAIVNQHIFKVIPKAGYPMWLVNQAVRSKLADFKAVANDKATTMGHIQRRHLDEPVKIPLPESALDLDGVMDALWAAALSAEIENLKLSETRDELLPLLMGGRIPIQSAVDEVKDAV